MEYVFAIIVLALVLGVPLVALIIAIIALVRTRALSDLERRLARLEGFPERAVRGEQVQRAPPIEEAATAPPWSGAETVVPEVASEELVTAEVVVPPSAKAVQWELFVGQKALGWVAVILGIFGTAFFLKYAYDNNWIGPLGRVAIGALIGCALVIASAVYQRRQWPVFAQMLAACGIVVLYLVCYSAFGFYHLLPQAAAGLFLTLVVGLSMILAARYGALAVAIVAVVGGILTPLLLSGEDDPYVALFIYLVALNVGVVLLLLVRPWWMLGSLALAGSQMVFWIWYSGNYHPEKLTWTITCQGALYGLYLVYDWLVQYRAIPGRRWESALRMIANAAFGFTAVYVLFHEDYDRWMGATALGMVTVYASSARWLLHRLAVTQIECVTSLAIAVGFLALAIPLEADARWIALGWAATGAALWWFGTRIDSAPLRALAGILGVMSVWRLILVDLQAYSGEPYLPLANPIAGPAAASVACLLIGMSVSWRWTRRLDAPTRVSAMSGMLVLLLVLWLVLSVDLYQYFRVLSRLDRTSGWDWRLVGQMSLSVLWIFYASALLAVGFGRQISALRWLAIALYCITVAKVFVLDMAGLREIYRIVAFLVVALVLGAAARFYQRLGQQRNVRAAEEGGFNGSS